MHWMLKPCMLVGKGLATAKQHTSSLVDIALQSSGRWTCPAETYLSDGTQDARVL